LRDSSAPQDAERKTLQYNSARQHPNFTQDTTAGKIRFHEWLADSSGVLFSHPKDYTPVCTTELVEVARLKSEWDKRNGKPVIIAPRLSNEEAKRRFPGGWKELKPYLRVVYQPPLPRR
jgi:alkyl hydroperoxide reductase subunit AhpC